MTAARGPETTHKALFALSPAESKRLIGQATVAEPMVQRALERGVFAGLSDARQPAFVRRARS